MRAPYWLEVGTFKDFKEGERVKLVGDKDRILMSLPASYDIVTCAMRVWLADQFFFFFFLISDPLFTHSVC